MSFHNRLKQVVTFMMLFCLEINMAGVDTEEVLVY